ncbi:MAG: hypothetical protein K2L51_03490, partial [Clostridiales bacterium]|nr:hypothetical protein [Clostridiales bacterium]
YVPPTGTDPKWAKQGYGLVDTMGDVVVSTCSAFVVCVLGYIALRKKANYLNRFLLRKIPDYDTAINEAIEAGDEKLAAALRKAKEEALNQIMSEPHHHFTPQEQTEEAGQAATENDGVENGEDSAEENAEENAPVQGGASEEEPEDAKNPLS